nr:hypothetical protein [Tanacetum cinerariifolium]
MIIKIKEMRNEVSVNGAAVTIPIEAVESVNARFVNTLYGYFIGDRLAFPLVENYVKNTWAKYGLKRIQLHEEFFLFQFNTKEGMESVLENGPWLIRHVPLLLNEWTANTILKKDEIKRVPIGKPLMLDSYTSNMCLNSWGRSAYAWVLIEIAADFELMKSLIVAIPVGNKEGHTFAMIDIKYEWTPPRCASCHIFDHVSEKCPKLPKVASSEKVIEEGFIEVKKKKTKTKKKSKKQVKGVRLNKPTLNLQYQRVDKGKSSKINNGFTNKESTDRGPIQITTKNSFSALSKETDINLKDKECVNADGQTPVESQFVNDSDEDVDEYTTMEEPSKADSNNQGASTPTEMDFNAPLCVEDTSMGSSSLDVTMREFRDCVENMEVMDVQRTGLQYTWNQKPKGKDGILRKLNRVLANLKFLDVFMGAHTVFKPYRISDHSPAVLSIPSLMKLKGLTKPIRKLMYDKGNLHSNVIRLREELDKVQTDLDSDPSNFSLREKKAVTVADFNEALLMEEKFLKQKAKITWLKERDSNTAYFPKVVKSRVSRSRIDVVTDAYGNVHQSTEIMHNYHLDRGVPRCAFKVDIQKAYDTVYWDFLRVTLIGFGFYERMIAWIMECVTTTSFSISINGSLHGYFEGKRGLRQGDPLSPYLFTLIMEVFTLMLKRRVSDTSTFTYHRFCSKLDLINLCFADNLFLFAHGDVNSAKVIKDTLDEFKDASGLNPSMPKSKAYFCNVINNTKLAILNILPFEEDRLPVKYLGVPLVSSRLISLDCKELIDKASVFMLPSRVLLDIEQIMRGFLWSQDNTSRGKVKVAWDVVCLLKQEGGLGIRRLDHFNKALMVSHVWKLLSLKESLWVKWIHVYKLKNRRFWDILTTFMWFDKWCDAGPLSNIISSRGITRAGFNHASKVRDCIQDGLWIWPHDWLVKYPILNFIPTLVISDNNSDLLEWRCRDGMGKPFSVHNVWDSIRPRDNLVPCCDLVWFHACISRHAFNMWLILKQRLRTQDCLRSWEVNYDLTVVCQLCETQPDSHEHLFFDCHFSQQVWSRVQQNAGLTGAGPSLATIIPHLLPIAKRRSSMSCIGKLIVAAAAYFIWHERNSRLFNKEIHVTWAHFRKKQTRLQLYTKVDEEKAIQWLETALQKHVTASGYQSKSVRDLVTAVLSRFLRIQYFTLVSVIGKHECFLCFLSLRSGMKRRVEMADGELLLREVAERMNKRTEEGMTQSHLVSSTVPLPPHQSNVDDAAIFGVSLTTVGDLEVLIKDIDDGKHEELLYGMTNYKRKIVMVTPPNGVAAKYKSGG